MTRTPSVRPRGCTRGPVHGETVTTIPAHPSLPGARSPTRPSSPPWGVLNCSTRPIHDNRDQLNPQVDALHRHGYSIVYASRTHLEPAPEQRKRGRGWFVLFPVGSPVGSRPCRGRGPDDVRWQATRDARGRGSAADRRECRDGAVGVPSSYRWWAEHSDQVADGGALPQVGSSDRAGTVTASQVAFTVAYVAQSPGWRFLAAARVADRRSEYPQVEVLVSSAL
ncbi:MAG: hypothetical protein QG671_533 [Actinomycetota bacterium]|nr:hypothetical protein [Actinomycetota bacterium]